MTKARGQHVERTRAAKQALLNAALEIVGEAGLAGLTLASVGIRAGFSRGLVQYHYGSKDALISAMIDWAVRGGRKTQQAGAARGLASLLTGIDEYNKARKSNPTAIRGYWVLTAEMSYSTNPKFKEQVKDYLYGLRQRFVELIVEDDIARHQAEPIAAFVLASFRGLVQQWVADPDLDIDSGFEELKAAVTLLVDGAKHPLPG